GFGSLTKSFDVSGVEPHISGLCLLQMFLDQRMELRQPVERHSRIGMMLGVVGHVPGELAHEPCRRRGPAVLEHIGDEGAAPMFGEEIKPQEWLPYDCRDNPGEEQRR